ncbi:hypothetical protein [Chryseobacterium sp.]|jgi:hypothetical protein|uniref:hypothetical protein n=1 Tax=Chryseobacterium sp. TaxID=1871047 RepID=UPI00283F09B3|nr:hypothetical protein [Chryseobacterium sp.]MDR3025740.1 hypothetical protein [Chryseobacterium sp.]
MTKTYNIKQTSVFLWVFSLLASIFVGAQLMILMTKMGLISKDQPVFIIVLVAPIIFFAFKVPRYIATVDIELIIDNEGLKKKWLKQFLFQNSPDRNISWTEIKDFVFEPDRQFDKFKLTLKDGTKFKFHHNTDHNSIDDFQQFLFDFERKISKLNTNNDKINNIGRGKTIYETVWGLALSVISILIIVAIIVVFIFFPMKRTTNYAALGASIIGAIYFISQVYIHRKNR